MPALRLLKDGAWLPPPAAGKLAVKSGGVWRYPAYVKVKDEGVWKDSGYLGYPGVPSQPWVLGWNYDIVHIQWNAPAAGAPVGRYGVHMLDQSGNLLAGRYETGTASYNWGVSRMTNYQFRVFAEGTSGLTSAMSPNLRISIGRPEQQIPHADPAQRPYYVNQWTDPVGEGGWIACVNPPNCTSHTIQFNLAVNQATSLFSGTATRKANWLIGNADWGYMGAKPNPWDEQIGGFGATTNSWNGCWLQGGGWYTYLGYGTVHLWGTEYYTNYWTEVIPAIGNGYW